MKNLALLALGVVLAACTSSSEDPATAQNAAAVKHAPDNADTSDKPVDAKPETPSKDDSYECSAKPEEPGTPAAETCKAVRALPAGGAFKMEVGEAPGIDVEASVSTFLGQDGLNYYNVALVFSDVENLSRYGSVGFPMKWESVSVLGAVTSKTELKDPWHGEFKGTTGLVQRGECKNGVATMSGMDTGASDTTIVVMSLDDDFLDATFEIRGTNGKVVSKGFVHAPLQMKKPVTSSKVGFHPNNPNAVTCCLLEK